MGDRVADAVRAERSRPNLALGALAITVVVGAILRFRDLGVPSLWLDEILGWDLATAARSRPWWAWLSGLEAEHGPLYYATQLLGRVAADTETAARLLPALFGTATIILVWIAGRYAGGYLAAFCAAALLATSPLHVYYSREGRPYALMMLLAAAMIAALLRQSRVLPAIVAAAVYTSAAAAPLAMAGAVGAFLSAAFTAAGDVRRRMLTAGALSTLALCLVPLLYRGERPLRAAGADFPQLDVSFFDSLFRSFAVTATGSPDRGRTAAVVAALVLAGCVAIASISRRRAVIVIAMVALPAVIALAALAISGHWYAVRYLSTALPAYVILAAAGITGVARLVARYLRVRPRFVAALVSLAAVIAVSTQTIPQAAAEPLQKLDWQAIARTIDRYAHEGDLVVAAEPWSAVSLRFYLRRVGTKVRLYEVADPRVAALLLRERGRAWFVTAGYSPDTAVRDWMCQYPIVLASALEEFRLHYGPSLQDFLRHRSTLPERRAFAASYGAASITLDMSDEDATLLGAGWAAPEGEEGHVARWAIDGRSEVVLPLPSRADRFLRLRLLPLVHRGLPPQTMRVLLNGHELGERTLEPGWSDLEIAAPASTWREDGANVLLFEFARANAPAHLDPAASDPRRLTAQFDTISVGSSGREETPSLTRERLVRLHPAAAFSDGSAAWRGRRLAVDPARLDRGKVESLLGRLGVDPKLAWPAIVAGTIRIDDLVIASALYLTCEDDIGFIRRTWRLLFARPPNTEEERVLRSILRSSRSRMHFTERIARMDEFRAAIQSP